MSEKLTAYEIVFVNFNWKGNLDGVSTHNFLPESQVKYILFDRHQSQIQALEEKLRVARDALIFYSDADPDDYIAQDILDWDLVNNGAAIQDKGKRARESLAAIKEKKE